MTAEPPDPDDAERAAISRSYTIGKSLLGIGVLVAAGSLVVPLGMGHRDVSVYDRDNVTVLTGQNRSGPSRAGQPITETWAVAHARSAMVDITPTCTLPNGRTRTFARRTITSAIGSHPVTIVTSKEVGDQAGMRCSYTQKVVGVNGASYAFLDKRSRYFLIFVGSGLAIMASSIIPVLLVPRKKKINLLPGDAPSTTALLDRWAAAKAELVDLTEQWLSYEKDYATFLSAPAMRDYSQPTTLAAAEALGDANTAAQNPPGTSWPRDRVEDAVTMLEKAVRRFASDLSIAVDYAAGAALSTLTDRERMLLDRAQHACAIATSPGSTRGEISNALAVLRASVRELDLPVPETARHALDARVYPTLEPARPAPAPLPVRDATPMEDPR